LLKRRRAYGEKMKHINIKIDNCCECPYVSLFDDIYLEHLYCQHKSSHGEQVKCRNRDGTAKDMSKYIHQDCPLPNVKELIWDFSTYILDDQKCPKCESTNIDSFVKCDGTGVHKKQWCCDCGNGWGDHF
jgi:hypothetical protein